MAGRLNALVTFSSNGERNRALNAIQSWVASWNSTHPGEQMTGTATTTFYQYPADDEAHPGVNARAVQATYDCSSYSGIEDMQRAIAEDVNANAYWDVINLSTQRT